MAEISRANPSSFIFLIDHSLSMDQQLGGGGLPMRKSDAVAEAVNRLLSELTIKCAKEEGVRDYFHVGVIGYGDVVEPAFGGMLADRELVPLSELAAHPARLEERVQKAVMPNGRVIEQKVKSPVWVEPLARGETPMTEVLTRAQSIIGLWLRGHPGSFPPIVLNITDGSSSDGDPSAAAAALQALASADGNVLLFNLHLSSDDAEPIVFPSSIDDLPDEHAARLFAMSSPLPERMRQVAMRHQLDVGEGARGFVFNADISAVVQFLDVGTQVMDAR